MEQIADGMWMGRGTDVNWMLVRDGSDLTLVDAGYPADIARLEADLRSIGHDLGDIGAVLVTHAHIDHIGGLQGLLSRHDVPVLMAAQELPLATGEQEKPGSGSELVRMAWRPNVAMWLGRVIRSGALHEEPLRGAQTWSDGGPLDLPGRPVPVASPGHTPGHTAYFFPEHGVLATGDALATAHPLTAAHTPHLLPSVFNASDAGALAALDALAAVDADVIVPGHGDVWRGPIARAVDLARSVPTSI